VKFTARAQRQLDDLRIHYIQLGRIEAGQKLSRDVMAAIRRIEADPEICFVAPRVYPQLARTGRAWIKQGRYWFFYSLAEPPVMLGVFYDTADIPKRT
jgi:plasmid stabilization system protein ParE